MNDHMGVNDVTIPEHGSGGGRAMRARREAPRKGEWATPVSERSERMARLRQIYDLEVVQ